MNKNTRIKVWNKYHQRCAYCGKPLAYKDMQVDHFIPKRLEWWCINPGRKEKYNLPETLDHISNLKPSCGSCNHYKRAELPESFRHTMKTIHKRIKKIYIVKVAEDYGLIQIKEWDGVFYFEKCLKRTK
jgi:5-methylcytosine-specific restriction endonuclease McrA